MEQVKSPPDASAALGADGPHESAEPSAATALRSRSLPLVALIARLRDSTPGDVAALRRTLTAEVARFEADARVAGVDEASIAAASYILCAWADQQFEAAPWGAEGAGLLQRFHHDAQPGDRLMRLLARLAEKPAQHRGLLELFHTCLSLGLRARTAEGRGEAERGDGAEREALRSRVHLALRQAAPAPALSAPWHCASAAARPPQLPRATLPAVLLLGVLALAVYSASQVQLASRVDGVLASLQGIVPARTATASPMQRAAPPRLAPALREDIAAGRVAVRDEPLRSVVIIAVGSRPPAEDTQSLSRLGAALAKQPGQVLVVGYTDGSDSPTARTPSPWHQAMEWARGVADVLGPQVGDARVAVEARVDAAAAPPARRVEIVLFPQ